MDTPTSTVVSASQGRLVSILVYVTPSLMVNVSMILLVVSGSVTVTVYSPASRSEISALVAPLLHANMNLSRIHMIGSRLAPTLSIESQPMDVMVVSMVRGLVS